MSFFVGDFIICSSTSLKKSRLLIKINYLNNFKVGIYLALDEAKLEHKVSLVCVWGDTKQESRPWQDGFKK